MSVPCRIVIADDNSDVADTLVKIVGAIGYRAIAAYDGRKAVQACEEFKPDLGILDIEMPMLDGCSAARLIRASASPTRMIAALSALPHGEEPMKSQGRVFDVKLAKPARMDELIVLLTERSEPRHSHRKLRERRQETGNSMISLSRMILESARLYKAFTPRFLGDVCMLRWLSRATGAADCTRFGKYPVGRDC